MKYIKKNECNLELIWKAHDTLSIQIKQSERNCAVLSLVFLKYINDKFEYKYRESINIDKGFEEDQHRYISNNTFWIPKEARWSEILKYINTPCIGDILDKAIYTIERENQHLKNLIYKVFSNTNFKASELSEMIIIINDINLNMMKYYE